MTGHAVGDVTGSRLRADTSFRSCFLSMQPSIPRGQARQERSVNSLHYRWLGSCVLAALLVTCNRAHAEEEAGALETVVVTASRTAQPEDSTLAPLTVLTREDIDILQPASLLELIGSTPGVVISNSGGPGKAASVFLRGTSGAQVLVLVDGVRMGSVSFGGASLPYLPLEQVERIEIVRGPFSSLYGSDAIGGVIQIFLRHDSGTSRGNASIGVGSYDTRKASAGYSAAGTHGWLSAQASHERSDGINACRLGAAAAFAACFADDPDLDGFKDNALTLTGGYRFDERWSVDGVAFRSEGNSQFDGSMSDAVDYSIQNVGGQLHYQLAERVQLSLRGGSSTDFSTNLLHGVEDSRFDSRRSMASLQADIRLAPGLLTLGYDWERQALSSTTAYDVTERRIRGLYAQWQARFGAHSLQASLRRDDNSQFGGKTTGSVLWGVEIAEGLRLTADYGSAFRAPTFNDLYYPGYSTPTLRPENSRNLQFGVRGTPAWGQWSLQAYRNDIRDLIEFDASTYKPSNLGRARIVGLEGVLRGEWQGWDLRATATLMRPTDETPGSAYAGHQLPRRARRIAHFDADRNFGRFRIGAGWQVVGQRYDDIANRHPLGGYALLNLRGGWQINPDWSLDLALNNVLDKSYETAWYFNQPGRNGLLTLNWRPAR